MRVLPAIDLSGGEAVRLVRGDMRQKSVMGDPLTWAARFAAEGARLLHVVDLDGAFAGTPRHLDLVRELSRILPVQLGGGLRSPADIEAALEAGASRLILGTAAVESPELLAMVPEDALVVGVDVKHGRVAVRGWEEEADLAPRTFVERLRDTGVQRILCTAVHRDGTLTGPDVDVLRDVAVPGVAVIASGGIASWDDIDRCAQVEGCDEAVVGKALYAGAMGVQRC